MRVLLAFLLPPVGLLLNGNFLMAVLMTVLCCTLIGYPVAMLASAMVVMQTQTNRGNKRLIKALAAR